MNGAAIRAGARSFMKTVSKHSPAIAAGVGIASIFATAFFAVKSTPKAHEVTLKGKRAMEEAKKVYRNEPTKSAAECRAIRREMAKQYAKLYWPAVTTAALGTASIIFSHRVSTKRNLALASAYAMTLNEYREYRKHAQEMKYISSEKDHEIRDAINKDRIEAISSQPMEGHQRPDSEKFFFEWSGQKFWSTVNEIDKKVNEFNFELNSEMEKPINDLCYKLGIKQTPSGDFTVSIDHGPIRLVYGSIFIEEEGRSYTTVGIEDIERRVRIG